MLQQLGLRDSYFRISFNLMQYNIFFSELFDVFNFCEHLKFFLILFGFSVISSAFNKKKSKSLHFGSIKFLKDAWQ